MNYTYPMPSFKSRKLIDSEKKMQRDYARWLQGINPMTLRPMNTAGPEYRAIGLQFSEYISKSSFNNNVKRVKGNKDFGKKRHLAGDCNGLFKHQTMVGSSGRQYRYKECERCGATSESVLC